MKLVRDFKVHKGKFLYLFYFLPIFLILNFFYRCCTLGAKARSKSIKFLNQPKINMSWNLVILNFTQFRERALGLTELFQVLMATSDNCLEKSKSKRPSQVFIVPNLTSTHKYWLILLPTGKSTLSLWKLRTFTQRSKFDLVDWLSSNYLIMVTLNLFELNWWDRFWEINVQNNKKVGKFFLIKFIIFQI
jgi:hypothetical protein